MNAMISDFKKIKDYSASFETYDIYSYLYFIGITNVKEDIKDEDLLILIEKCNSLGGEYTDPIEVGQSIASEIYEEKSITIDQIKELSVDQFYDWYNGGREIGNNLEIDEREMN